MHITTHTPSVETARWTVMVSKETDLALRSFLGNRGSRKGDLSKFIEEAVRWRMFDRNLANARAGFADLSATEVENLVNEAVTATRRKNPRAKSKPSS